MLRNSKMAPLVVTDKEWLTQSNLSFEDSIALKHVGRWALPVPRKILNETWKKARIAYKLGELGTNCKYLMCSTGADQKQKNGMIMFFFASSKDEVSIEEAGHMIIDKMSYKAPSGVNAIYYKSKTVGADKKFLYKLELPSDDSESD